MSERPTREQVPEELQWDVTGIYPSHAAWEADLARLNPAPMTQYRGRLGEGAGTLLTCLQLRDALQEQAGRISFYPRVLQAGDGTNPEYQGMMNRAAASGSRVYQALAFIEPELLALPAGTLEGYAADATLQPYARQLRELIRRRPHVLGQEGETVLSALGQSLATPYQLYSQIVSTDLRCEPVQDSEGNTHAVSVDGYFWKIAFMPDRELRRRAHVSLMAGLRPYRATLGTNLINQIRKQVSLARVRRFGSAAEMMLHPHHVDVAFYRRAVDTLLEEAKPVAQKLLRLRKRLWGVDRLYPYDLMAPLVDSTVRFSFEEGAELIRRGLEPLGAEYGQVVDTALRERWIDRADNLGRFPNPVTYGQYGVHSYILITGNNRLTDAMCLAHELGHAVHRALIDRNQSIGDSHYSMLVGETAATANQWLCGQYLISSSDAAVAAAGRRQMLEFDFVGFFCTMILHERLLQRLYDRVEAGQPVSAGKVYQLEGEIWRDFYGDELVLDEASQMEWTLMPHFYFDTLYPHSYAVATSASFAIANRIREEGAPAVERWLTALKAGGTLPPLAFWRTAGVEMDSDEPLRQAVRYFDKLVDELG